MPGKRHQVQCKEAIPVSSKHVVATPSSKTLGKSAKVNLNTGSGTLIGNNSKFMALGPVPYGAVLGFL